MLIVLGVLLLILKLAGVVTWAWWIVLIPFYPVIGVSLIAGCLFILGALAAFFNPKHRKK